MNILHYTLGFSPYRSGGLVRYAKDLMQAEQRHGHIVFALYPGGTSLFKGSCCVHKDNVYDGIRSYEMSNPLPVPLMYGVKDVKSETVAHDLDRDSFARMVSEIQPEVFHVHTLMGLPVEYLKMIHECGVRIVYTSHDYFGLCPKVNFVNQDGAVCIGASAERCAVCNAHAKSAMFLKVRNSKLTVPLKSLARRMKR